jgi:hypothetical protein
VDVVEQAEGAGEVEIEDDVERKGVVVAALQIGDGLEKIDAQTCDGAEMSDQERTDGRMDSMVAIGTGTEEVG